MPTFNTPAPITMHIKAPAGRVRIDAVETDTTELTLEALNDAGKAAIDAAIVEFDGRTLTVDVPSKATLFGRSPSVAITVRGPSDSTLDVSTGSAELTATGRVAGVTARSGSGNLTLADIVGDANLRSGSGDVAVTSCEGSLTVASGSGDITIGTTGPSAGIATGSGDVHLGAARGTIVSKTGSGDVRIDDLDGSLTTKSGSGDTTVARATAGDVTVTTASGDITVGVMAGTAVWLDLSSLTGRVNQRLDEISTPTDQQRRLAVAANAVSGNITIQRA